MKPYELFKLIQDTKYQKTGLNLDYQIIVDSEDKVVRLLFQETCGVFDWFVNFNFLPWLVWEKFHFILTCRGWGTVYLSGKNEIFKELLKTCEANPDFDVEISGWSYGGAMAQIFGWAYNKLTGKKANVITFGAPKPFYLLISKFLAKRSCATIKNYSHVNDCVTYVPPFLPYHLLKRVKLGSGFSIFKLFDPGKYHTMYGEAELYSD